MSQPNPVLLILAAGAVAIHRLFAKPEIPTLTDRVERGRQFKCGQLSFKSAEEFETWRRQNKRIRV